MTLHRPRDDVDDTARQVRGRGSPPRGLSDVCVAHRGGRHSPWRSHKMRKLSTGPVPPALAFPTRARGRERSPREGEPAELVQGDDPPPRSPQPVAVPTPCANAMANLAWSSTASDEDALMDERPYVRTAWQRVVGLRRRVGDAAAVKRQSLSSQTWRDFTLKSPHMYLSTPPIP